MRARTMGLLLGATLAFTSGVSNAQLGDLMKGLSGSGGKVNADQLVKKYVDGTKNVMKADINLLKALGLKEQAAKEELALKNLTEGATSSGLEDAAKIQTESSQALAEKMGQKNIQMDEASKKQYSEGLTDLAKGLRDYLATANDAKGFKPSPTDMFGNTGKSALFIVKTLPDSTNNLKKTLGMAIDFGKANKIEVPADATSLL